MDNSCPATPPLLTEANSKSPLRIVTSSPDSDGMKSPSRDSPDSNCVICLGKLQNKSFTDSCLHQFCFQCLLTWSKVKAECPLCKQPFKSIIHNVRSNLDYDQYHIDAGEPRCVLSDLIDSFNFDLIQADRRFRYRSTMTRSYFRELAESFLARNNLMSNDYFQIPPMVPSDPALQHHNRLHRSARHRGTTEFRRNIYSRDLWVQDLRDISGRYRECSPQFYRDNPAQVHRIVPWLNREVNVLLSDCQSQAAYILTRIISYLSQHSIRSREFRELVQPYFGSRTDHFIHELYTFAHSVYDIAGFDQHAVYGPNPNYATEVQEISSSEDADSDIEVLETIRLKEGKRKKTKKSVKNVASKRNGNEHMSDEPVAGPSGIRSGKSVYHHEISESDQDDIKVLDYVKPVPEVVVLSSDEDSPIRVDATTKKECFEVVNDSTDKSNRVRLSLNEECTSLSESVKNRSKSPKGKCKWNGFGLKGKQKQKYIKCKKSRSRSRSRSSGRCSNSSRSSSSSSSSSTSQTSDHKSKRRRNKTNRKKYRAAKSSQKTMASLSKRHRSGSCSNSDTDKKRKKKTGVRVKSCVIVPSSKGCDLSPTVVGSKAVKSSESHRYPVSYWSMVTHPEEEKPSRSRRSTEDKPVKRFKHSMESVDLTSCPTSSDESTSIRRNSK